MIAPCTWTATTVWTIEEDVCELTIPNVISPFGNGQWDAKNDAFKCSVWTAIGTMEAPFASTTDGDS